MFSPLVQLGRKLLRVRPVRFSLALGLAVSFAVSATAQAPNSIQLPYINTFAGSPVGYVATPGSSTVTINNPVCATYIPTAEYTTANFYTPNSLGDGCPPSQALLKTPSYTYFTPGGSLLIGDPGDNAIREVFNGNTTDLNFLVTATNKATYVSASSAVVGYIYSLCAPTTGSYSNIGSAGGTCQNTQMGTQALAIDPCGNMFSSEGNSRIRMIYVAPGCNAQNLANLTDGLYGPISTVSATNPKPGALVATQQVPITYPSFSGYYGDGGPAYLSLMSNIKGIAVDAKDDLYVADNGNNLIRYISGTTGIITHIAGGASGCTLAYNFYWAVDGSSTSNPTAATLLAEGYIAAAPSKEPSATSTVGESGNPNVWGVQAPNSVPGGTFSAGGCTAGFAGDGGPASNSLLNGPTDLVLDANQNLWIEDSGNGRLRVIYGGTGGLPGISNPVQGYIYTIAGGGTLTTGGPALQVKFSSLTGLGFDTSGNIYIADGTGHRVWYIDRTSMIAVIIAGNGAAPAVTTAVPVTIPAIVPAACSSTFPTSKGGPMDTHLNGDNCIAAEAEVSKPQGHISIDSFGNVYVADNGANNVRVISQETVAAATAAVGSSSGVILGFAPLTALTSSGGIFSVQGTTGLSDFYDAGGSTCTGALAVGVDCFINVGFEPSLPGLRTGGVEVSAGSRNIFGSNFVTGSATGAELSLDSPNPTSVGSGLTPTGIASDPSGDVYVADKKSGSVFKYASSTATTPSATLVTGLSNPGQVFVDGLGDVLVADTGNSRVAIRSASTGAISYLTGFNAPQGVGVDGLGNIYVSDTGNNRVVRYLPGAIAQQVVSTNVLAPTQISIDGADNVYIVDTGNNRLVELPAGDGIQASIATGTFIPIAAGVDAAGDLYILDKITASVGFISAQGAVTSILYSGLTTPASLSIDSLGNVYVADSSATSATVLNRQQITTTFFPLDAGLTSAFSSFVLTNIGNAYLNFTTSSAFAATGSTADFQVSPSANNGCSGASLASGVGCSISAVFAPAAVATYKETLTFPSNAANTATASSTLLGNGVNLLASNLAISSNPSASTKIPYGSPITLTFALTQSGTVSATGSILVQVNGIQQATLTPKNGAATYTFTPQAGQFTIAGQYSGDSNYSSSHSSIIVTVVPAPTTTAITYSGASLSVTGTQIASYVLSATVTSTVPVIGTVNFFSGSTLLGTAAINNKGVATLILYDSNPTPGIAPFVASTPTAPGFILQNPVFTSTYTGGANFAPSNSNSVSVNGDIGLSTLSNLLAAPQGTVSNTFIVVTPFLGLNGNVTFSCTGLPANTLCRFLPNTLAFPQPVPTYTSIENAASNFGVGNYYPLGGAGFTQVQLYTNVPSNLAQNRPDAFFGQKGGSNACEAGLVIFSGALFFAWRGRRTRLKRNLLLVLLLAVLPLFVGVGLIGCGGGNYYSYPQVTTPEGTYNITVVATTATGSTESIPLTLTVGAP